jgi:hypothetical protein
MSIEMRWVWIAAWLWVAFDVLSYLAGWGELRETGGEIIRTMAFAGSLQVVAIYRSA